MSPKKKPAPTAKSATKDDLINSLFDSENAGDATSKNSQTKSETISRLSDVRRMSPKSPPPPPSKNDNDRIYDFDADSIGDVPPSNNDGVYDASKDDTRPGQPNIHRNVSESDETPTLSIVRNQAHGGQNPHSVPTFDAPDSDGVIDLQLEENKTTVHAAERDDSVSGVRSDDIPTSPNVAIGKQNSNDPKSAEKLQKLEEVLRRLKPQFPGKGKAPLFDSATAIAAVDKAKSGNAKALDSVAPPPVKPVGVVAKAMYSGTNPNGDAERAPTEPVQGHRPSLDSSADEKTVANPQAAPSRVSYADRNQKPIWEDAKTEVLSRSLDGPEADREAEQFMPTEIRANSPGVKLREEARQAQPGAAIFSSAEAALRQSENLRVAQKRISDLENELERVRRENESLRSAGDTLRRRMDELQAHAENAEQNTQEAKKIAEEERKVLKGQIQSRDREISEMKGRIDDAETRLEANFRKIRVRERDLEHRIEIIKAESQSIAASKDRMILELKRQIDQISSELSHAKTQVQETFGQFKEKQETARRAVRALRIALTVLEGEEDSGGRKSG